MPKKIEYKGNNTFVLRVPVGYTEKGYVKTKNRTITAKSMDEAEAMFQKFEAGVRYSTVNTGKFPETVAELVEYWFLNVGNIGRKQQTIAQDRYISRRIIEALGHLKVRKVTYNHLNTFTTNLIKERSRNNSQKFLSSRTIRAHQDFLKIIFGYAQKIGLRMDNPTDLMTMFVNKKKKLQLPDKQFISDYLNAIDTKPINLKCATYMALLLGLRRGEICGLLWENVNFDAKTVNVKLNRIKYDKNVGLITNNDIIVGNSLLTSLKTEQSERMLALPDILIKQLLEVKACNEKNREIYMQLPGYEPIFTKFVFLNEETGRPIGVDTLSRITAQIAKKCGQTAFTFHKLRHLATSVLLEQKIPLNVVQHVLGHADAQTTLDTYAHLLKPVDKEAAEIMQEFVNDVKSR